MIFCELCPRAYHHDCYIPPMIKVTTASPNQSESETNSNPRSSQKVPRGKWYCHGCVAKAPPPKKRGPKKPSSRDRDRSSNNLAAQQQSFNLSTQSLNMSAQSLNTSTQSLNNSSIIQPMTPTTPSNTPQQAQPKLLLQTAFCHSSTGAAASAQMMVDEQPQIK